MKFSVLSLIGNPPHPVTGRVDEPADRFAQVVENAAVAEELGFDAYAVGERHTAPFLSSAPTVVLGALSARTSRIRLLTGVTVLSVLDPVRVAEDYATVDQLSRGRLELVVGKGAEASHFDLFGLREEHQWEYLAEKYGLLHRLWREERMAWQGRHRAPLTEATTFPRPFAGPPRVWHGSATSANSTELAARYGDPLFTANAIQPRESYARLVRHYRERFAAHGHDPADAHVAAGSGGLYLAETTARAITEFREVYEGRARQNFKPELAGKAGYNTPFRTIEEAVEDGPALIGSPQRVIDKIMTYHASYGHDLQSLTVDGLGLDPAQQREQLQRFAEEVAPALRDAAPTRLWEEPATAPTSG